MTIKGVIQLNEEIEPFSRMYIAEKLMKVDSVSTELSSLETEGS